MNEYYSAFWLSVGVIGSCAIFQGLQNMFSNRFMKRAVSQYKDEIFGKILKKNIGTFCRESVSSYLSAFSNDMASIEQNYLLGFFDIAMQLVLLVGGVLAMAYLNWKMFLITLAACMIPILASTILGDRLTSAEKNISSSNAKFTALVNGLLSGFSVIKSFKAEKKIESIFQYKNDELEQVKKKRHDLNSVMEVLNEGAGNVVQIVVFASGVYMAIKGEMTVGVVVAFIQLLNYVLSPISKIGVLVANRKAAGALIKKMDAVIYYTEVQDEKSTINHFCEQIEIKNLTFGYEPGIKNLHNVNLRLDKGKSYAIVGASGSGKTTLLNLLWGHHDNYEGSIQIDGNEVRNISKDSLFDIVTIIQQNVFIFDTSIEENITLFKEFERNKIENAVRLAGLTELIAEKGGNYKCGENGENLSGGEKQRISIARCLVKDSSILLVDEATAALDNKTSFLVEESILNLDNLTKVMITHKLNEAILKKFDSIIVMNQGTVAEIGTFEELMDKKKYFYSLFMVSNSSSNPC